MVESYCLVLVESFSLENLSMIESCPFILDGSCGFFCLENLSMVESCSCELEASFPPSPHNHQPSPKQSTKLQSDNYYLEDCARCDRGVVEGTQVFLDPSLLVLAIPDPKTPASKGV